MVRAPWLRPVHDPSVSPGAPAPTAAEPAPRQRCAGWKNSYSAELAARKRVRVRLRAKSTPLPPPSEVLPVGHGHARINPPAPPADRRVRVLIAALLVPCALATLVGVALLWPSDLPATASPTQQPVGAEVVAESSACVPDGAEGCVALVIRMQDGPLSGHDLLKVVPAGPGSPRYSVGDGVVLGWSGGDPNDSASYEVLDFQRGPSLLWLAGIFAAAVLLLCRWRGLGALGALLPSFGVLLVFVLPAILSGHDPLAVAVVGSCLIVFVVLYMTHGFSARTSTAVLGTLVSLALIGVLGAAFSGAAQLTGLDERTSTLIVALGTAVDARGLLLAGVIIGALGVLQDVAITQSSVVWELRRTNPGLGARSLFGAAMRIGRDHVASAVNTLALAYAGAALPLLLLFAVSGRTLGEVATAQDVATEVVRTLVGGIGLLACVPITTALAAMASREPRRSAPRPISTV
jgi:uncharacterized membrane protein